jgi:hypothetical protein
VQEIDFSLGEVRIMGPRARRTLAAAQSALFVSPFKVTVPVAQIGKKKRNGHQMGTAPELARWRSAQVADLHGGQGQN